MNFLCADLEIVNIHTEVQDYASAVNQSIVYNKSDLSSYPLGGGALFALTANLFGMHRAIYSLCRDGWAFSAGVLLRSMLDMLINVAVIVEKKTEVEYRGFKYMHFFLKRMMTENISSKDRSTYREQIKSGIEKLPADLQLKAKGFMFNERLHGYWFCPEYKRPTDVLNKLFNTEICFLYEVLSSGSHGSYMGLGMYKDEPDAVHPNPRADRYSQNKALVGSSRILLEAMNIRDVIENDGKHNLDFDDIIKRLSDHRDCLFHNR